MLEPPLADERLSSCLDFRLRRSVDHVGIIGRDFLVQPLGRVRQQVAVLVHRAALHRNVRPQRGPRGVETFGVHRNTISKMLQFSVPPGYRRRERPASKKLGPYMAWIDTRHARRWRWMALRRRLAGEMAQWLSDGSDCVDADGGVDSLSGIRRRCAQARRSFHRAKSAAASNRPT